MAIVREWHGDSAPVQTITTGNLASSIGTGDDPFTSLSGAPQIVNSGSIPTRILIVGASAVSAAQNVRMILPSSYTTVTFSFMWTLDTLPAGGVSPVVFSWFNNPGLTLQGELDFQLSQRRLRIRNASAVVTSGTALSLSVGTEYRVQVGIASNTITVKIYSGRTTTLVDTISGSVTSTVNEITLGTRFGTADMRDTFYDDFMVEDSSADIPAWGAGTSATAQVAAVTVGSQNPSTKIFVMPGVANVGVVAQTPAAKLSLVAAQADVTTAAQEADPKVSPIPAVASVTVAATGASAIMSISAQVANLNVAAVGPASTVKPTAAVASVAAAALAAASLVKPPAGVATVTVAAIDAEGEGSSTVVAEVAAVTVTAIQAVTTIRTTAEVANVSATAQNPSERITPSATAAAVVATGASPMAAIMGMAGVASVLLETFNAGTYVSVVAELTDVATAALDATATSSVNVFPQHAEVIAEALEATISIDLRALAEGADILVVAYDVEGAVSGFIAPAKIVPGDRVVVWRVQGGAVPGVKRRSSLD